LYQHVRAAAPGVHQRIQLVRWSSAGLVAGSGLVVGAALGRVLAELPCAGWPFWLPVAGIALAAFGGVAALAFWWWRGQGSGAPALPLYALALYLFHPGIDLLQAGVLLAAAVSLCILLGLKSLRFGGDWLIAAILFAVALGTYLYTLTPAVGTRDGYELQAISATLGYAHPTGYPLFPILGRAWLLAFPFGGIAWRVNVLCALYAAATIPLLYAAARRVLGSRAIAAFSALLFAFSNTLWTQAVRPEKYTLNAFFVALVLYIAFGTTNPERRVPHPHLRWLALAYGLSLTHHRTMLMLAPALALYVLWRDPGLPKRPRDWLPALALGLAPLSIYLYIPWRAAAQGSPMSANAFLRYIAGTYYSPAVRLMDWANPERAGMFWRFLLQQYHGIGVALGLLGVVALGLRRQWRVLACTVLAYLTYYVWGTVWYAYYNDVNSFIPNHMIYALWIGSGALVLQELLQRLARLTTRALHWPQMAHAAMWSLLALMPASLIWTNGPQVDARNEWNLTRWGEAAVAEDLASDATILADRAKYPPLDYYARIEQQRPGVDVVLLGDESAYLDRLRQELAQGNIVYLARFLPGLEGSYHLRSMGPLVEVATAPVLPREVPVGTPYSFGDSVRLLRTDLAQERPPHPGDACPLTLYWQAVGAVPGNYQVNLRLVSDRGQVWWSTAGYPVSGMYPTAAWKPEEVVRDWHEILIPESVPPGTYAIEVGLFPSFSEAGLPVDGGSSWLPVDTIEVTPGGPPPAIGTHLRVVAPRQWQIVGYDLPDRAPPTSRVPLTLYWQALAPLPDLEIGTRLWAGEEETAWTWEAPANGEYPSSSWVPGQIVVTHHRVQMPAKTGRVRIEVAVREEGQDQRTPFYAHWLAPKTDVLVLPPLTVVGRPPAAPGTSNYADRILLLQAEVGTDTLRPGEALELQVRWECLQAMESDYTLFVQLLGPEGKLRGQVDVWPKDGTHPTSAWREGEAFQDRYTVYADADAPPGRYQVAIGWYLLETMQRLPVLDAEGRAVDDKVLLAGLTVTP
jgi:hypothetical protein